MAQETLNFKIARIHKLSSQGRLKAFVDLSISDALIVRGLRVVDGHKGLFVSMPQEQGKDKKWYDTIRCVSRDVRTEIAQCVLKAYKEEN